MTESETETETKNKRCWYQNSIETFAHLCFLPARNFTQNDFFAFSPTPSPHKIKKLLALRWIREGLRCICTVISTVVAVSVSDSLTHRPLAIKSGVTRHLMGKMKITGIYHCYDRSLWWKFQNPGSPGVHSVETSWSRPFYIVKQWK